MSLPTRTPHQCGCRHRFRTNITIESYNPYYSLQHRNAKQQFSLFDEYQISCQQHGLVLEICIKIVVTNPISETVTLGYSFPLNTNWCNFGLKFTIDGNVVSPSIMPNSAAQEVFDDATSNGDTAVLGKMTTDSQGEIVIGNLGTDAQATIEQRFVTILPSTGDGLDFDISFMKVSCARFRFDLAAEGALKLNGEDTQFLTTMPSSWRIEAQIDAQIQSALYTKENMGFFQYRPTDLGSTPNSDFVFILDCSGSMEYSISYVRKTAKLLCHALPVGSCFNIIKFGSEFESIFQTCLPVTDINTKTAIDRVNKFEANMGGTCLYAPLHHVLTKLVKDSGNVMQIFLLTDGEIDDRDQVIALVHQYRATARLFAIGIGADVDVALVRGLADTMMGRSAFVSSDQELSPKVLDLLARSMQPAVRNITLDSDSNSLSIAPFPIPPVFGDQSLGLALQNCGGSLLLTANGPDTAIEENFVAIEYPGNADALKALYAHIIMKDLRQEEIREAGLGHATDQIVNRIVQLSMESGVLSTHTSYVGIVRHTNQQTNAFRAPKVSQSKAGKHGKAKACIVEFADSGQERLLDKIIELQNIDGNWDNPLAIAQLIGFDEPTIGAYDDQFVATIFAIAILDRYLGDFGGSAFVAKAMIWLESNYPGFPVDSLVDDMKATLPEIKFQPPRQVQRFL